jgi:hypothetical protein
VEKMFTIVTREQRPAGGAAAEPLGRGGRGSARQRGRPPR